MPPDGGVIRPENVQMKPLFPKNKLNAKLSIQVFGQTVRSNSLPGGHTDLHCCHPGVKEDFVKGVLIIKVFSTSFRPEMVENEASKDVEVTHPQLLKGLKCPSRKQRKRRSRSTLPSSQPFEG
jgi:hypothetical protein